jgi:DnaJ like chaperone protein
MEILIATAFADGHFDAKEKSILEDIASDLGYTQNDFSALLDRVTGQAHFSDKGSMQERLQAAYDLLGVSEGVSDAELKKAYRRQMNQHHPDKLVAKGLPEEMIEIATQKTQDIKAAYELIKSEH